MKIKGENKIPIIIAIGVIIVIVLVVKDFKDRDQSTNYSNLTSEEITAAVNNEIATMEINTLSTMDERDRIEHYVSSFADAIEEEDYEKAYSMLYDDFKKNYFPNLSSFEEYAKNKLPKVVSFEHTNFERNGDYYILWITMSDPLSGKGSERKMNFVVKENDLNDFVISFSVI